MALHAGFWLQSDKHVLNLPSRVGRRQDVTGEREDSVVQTRIYCRNRLGCLLAGLAVGLAFQLLAANQIASAQDARPNAQPHAIENAFEGVQFVGSFGAEDEKNPKQDTFTFKDGKFATGSCLEWGFLPAPYWVRRGPRGLQFLAELKSPEHGTMRYEGVFDGKKLTVVGHWKKERWYWTIERTYRGHGRPSNAAP